jgi:hypothetical protein
VQEAATAVFGRKFKEERDQEFTILRQDRPDDDAVAAGQVHHVDQLRGIVMDPVSHIVASGAQRAVR